MKYNFDEIIDRRGSGSVKWKNLEEEYGYKDILPMWIADMDFKSSKEIIESLNKIVEDGVFGYGYLVEGFYDSIVNWVKKKHNWEIKKEWILFTPGVIVGFNIPVREFVKEGEKILVQGPVYPPFFRVMNNNNRIVNNNPLIYNGEKYLMDFEDLKSKIDKDTKLMMLCNPHNPVGRVWTKEELEKLGKICLDNNILIVSDEIHCDLTFKGEKHIPIASLSKELAENTITLMAPSKTFNIAGLSTSFAIIPNEEIREAYCKAIEAMEIGSSNIMGIAALEAAYNHGEDWLNQAMDYIEDNADYAIEYIRKNIPRIKVDKPEATYLLWLDFRDYNMSQEEITDLLINKGRLLLNDGSPYGTQGEGDGFFRINVACPRAMLEEGLKRLKKAFVD